MRMLLGLAVVAVVGCRGKANDGGTGATIDPSSDPTGVVENIELDGSTLVEGPIPAATSGMGTPMLTGNTTGATVTSGDITTLTFDYTDGDADVDALLLTAEGADAYLEVPLNLGDVPPPSGRVTVRLRFGGGSGLRGFRAGQFRCVYAIRDRRRNVSQYVVNPVTVEGPATGTDGGGGGSCPTNDLAALAATATANAQSCSQPGDTFTAEGTPPSEECACLFEDFLLCVANPSSWSCDADGNSQMSCITESQAYYEACAAPPG